MSHHQASNGSEILITNRYKTSLNSQMLLVTHETQAAIIHAAQVSSKKTSNKSQNI